MHKKKALVLWGYLSLLALAACWPKVIDDADIVSVDYVYSFSDWTLVEQWTKEFTMWANSDSKWMESIIRWARKGDKFEWNINWWEIFEHNLDMVEWYPSVVISEVWWLSDPKAWDEIEVSWLGKGIIVSEGTDKDWYALYSVDFNDPKTYSELSYSIKVVSIEKR